MRAHPLLSLGAALLLLVGVEFVEFGAAFQLPPRPPLSAPARSRNNGAKDNRLQQKQNQQSQPAAVGGQRQVRYAASSGEDDDGATTTTTTTTTTALPQVFATGFSPKLDLLEAIQDATDMALHSLPKPTSTSTNADSATDSAADSACIDLAFVTTSSLYDTSPSIVVPAVLSSASVYGKGIQKLVGCTSGGIISSIVANANNGQYDPTTAAAAAASADEGSEERTKKMMMKMTSVMMRECVPVESEGVPGVSVTLCLLPDVNVQTFHVLSDDVPDDVGRVPPNEWKNAVGLRGFGEARKFDDDDDSGSDDGNGSDDGGGSGGKDGVGPPVFMLIPSPAFQTELDDLLTGLSYAYPTCTTFGGIASTVSSLSRAQLFRYDIDDPQCSQTLGDGCVGVALEGDVEVQVMVAQGAKPVGGVYRIVSGEDSTIGAIMLDETATMEEDEAAEEDEEFDFNNDDDDDEDDDEDGVDDKDAKKAKMKAAYAKAAMPKPVLAEANYLMKTLSDDDQSFMRKSILVGLERGGSVGRTPNELARLARGEGHRFAVHQVASAGMKDGSVTLPLGSVNVQKGTRFRFFVREGKFAKKEVEALWTGYMKKSLARQFSNDEGGAAAQPFNPTGCMVLSTLDRGTKLFGGKPGYETDVVSSFLPNVPSIMGLYSNGVLGRLDSDSSSSDTATAAATAATAADTGVDTMVHGSASCYAVFGSKTNRPIYSPARAAAEQAAAEQKAAQEEEAAKEVADEDEKRSTSSQSSQKQVFERSVQDEAAPRCDEGELLLKRREVHSGRAISVSTVEWSVAEKTAKPTSALEGYMWDKETEVDRFRERVPLSNLVSQCKLFNLDASKPKPRDFIGPIKEAAGGGGADGGESFVIIPECKRMEPTTGSLRKRYDVAKIVKDLTTSGAPAIGVNCDPVLFGGSLEDVTKAREASSSAALQKLSSDSDEFDGDGVVAPPILASDLLLYPYQLYKLRLAGADAVTIIAGALESKDLLYLTKIAKSLNMQTVVSVTSEVQIRSVGKLSPGSISALVLSNRELEDFTFDETGEQALSLLKSETLANFLETHDVPVLVEGRVGIIERPDDNGELSSSQYIKELKEAGAFGAIVASGLAEKSEDSAADAFKAIVADA